MTVVSALDDSGDGRRLWREDLMEVCTWSVILRRGS